MTHRQNLLMRLIGASNGVISVDRMLIAIYKETGKVVTRKALMETVYKMRDKKMLFSINGGKVLSTTEAKK